MQDHRPYAFRSYAHPRSHHIRHFPFQNSWAAHIGPPPAYRDSPPALRFFRTRIHVSSFQSESSYTCLVVLMFSEYNGRPVCCIREEVAAEGLITAPFSHRLPFSTACLPRNKRAFVRRDDIPVIAFGDLFLYFLCGLFRDGDGNPYQGGPVSSASTDRVHLYISDSLRHQSASACDSSRGSDRKNTQGDADPAARPSMTS